MHMVQGGYKNSFIQTGSRNYWDVVKHSPINAINDQVSYDWPGFLKMALKQNAVEPELSRHQSY